MPSIQKMLQSINEIGFGDLGAVVSAKDGRWIIGDDTLFPLQIERLAAKDHYLLYATAVRATAEPVYVSLMKTMFVENLQGMSLGRYGICFGPVTLTLYQQLVFDRHFSAEKLAAMMACHRMLIECYLEGDSASLEDVPFSRLLSMMDGTVIPFRH